MEFPGTPELIDHPPAMPSRLPAPPGYRRTIRHNRFAITVGSHRIAFERVQDRYTMPSNIPADARPPSGKLLLGIATAGLFVAYVALLPSPSPASRYSAEMTIPDKVVVAPVSSNVGHQRTRHATPHLIVAEPAPSEGNAPASIVASDVTTTTIDASLDQPTSADVVDLPSNTGERAVEVLGPERRVGGKACRDVQIFSRDAAGQVSVQPVTRCGKP